MILKSYTYFNSYLNNKNLINLLFLVKLKTFNLNIPFIFYISKIYGISTFISSLICQKFGISKDTLTNSVLKETYIGLFLFFTTFLKKIFNKHYPLNQKYLIKYQLFLNYRGFRHTRGLPVNGQRTHTNAMSCRSIFFHNKILKLIKKFKV